VDEDGLVALDEERRYAKFAGEIDLDAYPRLSHALSQLLESAGDIVCDLRDVSFIDSSAIRLFVKLQRTRDDGSHVTLLAPQPNVERVLATAGVSALGIHVDTAP
jgi:anti-anti-sigma factor